MRLAVIKHPLAYILNMSLSQGAFADDLNIAYIRTIHKLDDSMQFDNYRLNHCHVPHRKFSVKFMYTKLL